MIFIIFFTCFIFNQLEIIQSELQLHKKWLYDEYENESATKILHYRFLLIDVFNTVHAA